MWWNNYYYKSFSVVLIYTQHSVICWFFFVLLILLSCGIFCIFLHTVGINFVHSFFISFSSHSWVYLINCLPPDKVSRSPQSRPHPPRLYNDVWVPWSAARKNHSKPSLYPIYLLKSQHRDKNASLQIPKPLNGKSQLWHSVKVDSGIG